MAKKSLVEREKKRRHVEARCRVKREDLKKQARAAYAGGEIPWDVQRQLQEMPRNSSRTRLQQRCRVCGRAHAVYRKFGLCRLCLRKFTMLGYIPGLGKASW